MNEKINNNKEQIKITNSERKLNILNDEGQKQSLAIPEVNINLDGDVKLTCTINNCGNNVYQVYKDDNLVRYYVKNGSNKEYDRLIEENYLNKKTESDADIHDQLRENFNKQNTAEMRTAYFKKFGDRKDKITGFKVNQAELIKKYLEKGFLNESIPQFESAKNATEEYLSQKMNKSFKSLKFERSDLYNQVCKQIKEYDENYMRALLVVVDKTSEDLEPKTEEKNSKELKTVELIEAKPIFNKHNVDLIISGVNEIEKFQTTAPKNKTETGNNINELSIQKNKDQKIVEILKLIKPLKLQLLDTKVELQKEKNKPINIESRNGLKLEYSKTIEKIKELQLKIDQINNGEIVKDSKIQSTITKLRNTLSESIKKGTVLKAISAASLASIVAVSSNFDLAPKMTTQSLEKNPTKTEEFQKASPKISPDKKTTPTFESQLTSSNEGVKTVILDYSEKDLKAIARQTSQSGKVNIDVIRNIIKERVDNDFASKIDTALKNGKKLSEIVKITKEKNSYKIIIHL